MNHITVTRNLVTDFAGDTLVDYNGTDIASGFTLTETDEGFEVSDGTTTEVVADPAEALRTYAEFIWTFADDVEDEATKAAWLGEIAKARKDADAL